MFRVVFALVFVCAHAVDNDLYCKDPDTNDYYPVNTTWSSKTFCGNYTCNIKPKTNSTIEPTLLKNDKITREAKTNKINRDIVNKVSEERKTDTAHIGIDTCVDCNEIDTDDRYLNSEEVNSLAKFLYSIKRSELDNLIEAYNMVNDMYGEMDSSASEINPEEIMENHQNIQFNPVQNQQNVYNPNTFPYWNSYSNYYSNLNSRPSYGTYPGYMQQNIGMQTSLPQNHYAAQNQHNIEMKQQNTKPVEMRTAASESHSSPVKFYPGFNYPNNQEKLQINIPQNYQIGTAPNGYPILLNPDNHVYPKVLYAVPTKYFGNAINFTNPYSNTNLYKQNSIPKQEQFKPYPANYNSQESFLNEDVQNQNKIHNSGYNNFGSTKTASDFVNCPWKTPSNQDILENVRAHFQPKVPEIKFPLKRVRLQKIGKVLRLDELKRKIRDVNEQVIEEITETTANVTDENVKHIKNNETTDELMKTLEIKLDQETIGATTDTNINVDSNIAESQITETENEEAASYVKEKSKISEQIRELEKQLKALEEQIHSKKQENDTMVTYITKSSCNLETEPGFFRTGDRSLPFPHCCPQRIE